jgi:hypothetical protein
MQKRTEQKAGLLKSLVVGCLRQTFTINADASEQKSRRNVEIVQGC